MAHEAGITITSLPGACACITALTLSGLPTRRFAFEAFLPTDKKERSQILDSLKNETRTLIIYEAPHHLIKTLEDLLLALGNRNATVCRELTKKHETVFKTTLETALNYYKENEPKGECVIVIEGRTFTELKEESRAEWQKLSIEEHVNMYMEQGLDKKEAMKAAAKDRGVSKQDIYKALL